MNQLTNFMSMSGYGQFIWPAFSISAILLAGILIHSQRFLRHTEKELHTQNSQETKMEVAEDINNETKE